MSGADHLCEKVPCPFCDLRPSIPPGEGRTATVEDLKLLGPAVVHHADGTVTEHGWEMMTRPDDAEEGTPISEVWLVCPECDGYHSPSYVGCEGLRHEGCSSNPPEDASEVQRYDGSTDG